MQITVLNVFQGPILNMSTGEMMSDEYDYFHTFVEKTHQKCSHDESLNFIQLQAYIYELLEKTLGDDIKYTSLDKDYIKFHCSHIIALIFAICKDLKTMIPCLPSHKIKSRMPSSMTIQALSVKLIENGKDLNTYFAKSSVYAFDRNYELWLQETIYDLSTIIWKISELNTIHDLMSLKMQLHCNYHLIQERYHAHISKPFMREKYRKHSIIGWKYFWNPRSTALIQLLSVGVPFINYGISYSLEDIIDKLQSAILQMIYGQKKNEHDLISSLCTIFQLRTRDIDIRNKNTLIFPILQHLYCLPFEDIWDGTHRQRQTLERYKQEVKETAQTSAQATSSYPTTTTTTTSTVPLTTLSNANPSNPNDQESEPRTVELDVENMTMDDIDLQTLQLHFILTESNGPGF